MNQVKTKTMTHEQRALADAALANRLNVIHHAYVDITGDLVAGALLGQILYWFGADRNGRTRARIVKDGFYWIAKTRNDWWHEIRISAKQYDRAAKILKEQGYIEIKTMKFNGNPTTHIRIVPHVLNAAIDAWKWERVKEAGLMAAEMPVAAGFSPFGNNGLPEMSTTAFTDGEEQIAPFGNNEITESGISLTEITAENTKKNTAENTRTLNACIPFADIWANYPKKEGRTKAAKAYEQFMKAGGNSEQVLVATVLYSQYINCLLENGELEWRYIPNGGTWFAESRFLDEIPSISSKLGYEIGTEYNRLAAKMRILAEQAETATDDERAAIRADIFALITALPYYST